MENNEKIIHFSDEVTIKIAVKNALPSMLRSMIPSSACIIRYVTFKNYSLVTWSEEAKKVGYPDATGMTPTRIGEQHEINVYWNGENVNIVTNFPPFKKKNFVAAIEKCPNLIVDEISTFGGLIGFFKCTMEKNTKTEVIVQYLNTIAQCYDENGNLKDIQ
ncbi:MAG: hypothetical protein MJZ00_07125 [Paludibacteraceae bacterium]|nr:hypothetical protein [Paludibacteraceae bacterium]